MADKFDPQQFFTGPDHVGLSVAAGELFGLLRRSLDLPGSWAALVTRKTGDHTVVPAGGIVEGVGADEVFFVRVSPVDVVIEEENIITGDRYQCRVEIRLRVSLATEPGELLSFRKMVLGGNRVVKTEALARYLRPAVHTALGQVASEHDAATLVDAGSAEKVSAALAEALKGPCFTAGLTLETQPTARFDSSTLRQVRQAEQEAVQRRAEHEASREVEEALEQAQARHLDHLASLLQRLKDMAAASPEVELPELLRTFSEHQRGELYEALFASEKPASQTRWIVVAAGDELLFYTPPRLDQPERRLTIAGAAGPVRSVQTARGADQASVLLLGAATGVYRLPLDRTEPDLTLCVPEPPAVRGGFNAAVLAGARVFASHSELGLYEWNLHEPGSPRPRFESMTRGTGAVRNVLFAEGSLYCSMDDRIIRWPADDPTDVPAHFYTGSAAPITSLYVTADGVYAGNSNGDVLHWPTGGVTEPERVHRGANRAAESVWLLAAHGVRRLVFTDTSLNVHARVLGDNFACRYEAGGQTLRRVEVAPDLLVATNDLRDRLFCWAPGQPAKPQATIAVARTCGHSIQDACLVAQT